MYGVSRNECFFLLLIINIRQLKLSFISTVTVSRIPKICSSCPVVSMKLIFLLNFSSEKKLLVSTMFTMEQSI